MRSFGLVEDKINEADFFIEAIKDCKDFIQCKYYFSAFVSATRSITFVLQACLRDIDGFDEWYNNKQQFLRNDELAKYFVEARNKAQKQGVNQIVGASHSYEDGRWLFFLDKDCSPYNLILSISKENGSDVYSQCRKYLCSLLEIIYDCVLTFKYVIDPFFYYSMEGLRFNKLTIEDIEESLGFPRGWTYVAGQSEVDRIIYLREVQPMADYNDIFQKYLYKCIDYSD